MANRVLVVGHSGLLGNAILSIPTNVQFIQAESRMLLGDNEAGKAIVSEAGQKSCTSILNLAWQSNRSDDYDQQTIHLEWCHATELFTRLAVSNGLKVYLIGTCLDSLTVPANEYVSAKIKLKTSLANVIAEGSVTWLRPFFVVSISAKRPRLIRGILSNQSEKFLIRSPDSTNDYVIVEDVASGIVASIENELEGEIDIGSGFLTSNLKLAQWVASKCGVPLPLLGNTPGIAGNVANTSILNEFGWFPKMTEESLG